MPWAVALKHTNTGAIELVTEGMRVDADDPRYENEVHIAPVKETGDKDFAYTFGHFGHHEFTRQCSCHPRIENRVGGRTLVIHSERVN